MGSKADRYRAASSDIELVSLRRGVLLLNCVAILSGWAGSTLAADIKLSRRQFRTGQYEECLESTRAVLAERKYGIDWSILMVKSLLALGRYEDAAKEIDNVVPNYAFRALKLAHTVYTQTGQKERAAEMLQSIYRIASIRRIESMESLDLVVVGESLLHLGGEPRLILDEFYYRALKDDPNCRNAYLAVGALALAKEDYDLASKEYTRAVKRFGDAPDAYCGLAQAFYHSDRQAMIKALDAALSVNPRHAEALVLLAEHQIDCENYAGARKLLDRATDVNPHHPDAWAYRTVLAHLTNEPNDVEGCRAHALRFWPDNPRVDYLIGRKLSQRYWFAEGAACQRQALTFDRDYLPAKGQLAEDLLRLGDEERGWDLANEVYEADPYNVKAYNLVTLQDNLAEFKVLSGEGIVLKMEPREAEIYGDRVLSLLQDAKSTLCKKYGLTLEQPVTVELFHRQQDFAIRTFGTLGGGEFLGVCFGNVITANSPKRETLANWESTLWHEFCHVITLNLTRNRMPRWLSEGISVYEEVQRDATCGQHMNPEYREMILGSGLIPISQLSRAFISPSSPGQLQFAYYESSLVVEFLIDNFGLDTLRAILADLGKGREINSTLARHTQPLEQIEERFAEFARGRAESLAEDADWYQPERDQVDPRDPESVTQWLTKHPDSLWALRIHARHLVRQREWIEAKAALATLITLYPEDTGEGNAYALLAEVHSTLGETRQEARILNEWASRSSDAATAYTRLMELGMEQHNWQQVVENGEKYQAVYPLLGTVHWRMGQAHEALGGHEQAVALYQGLLLLDPANPAEVNFRLASILQEEDPGAAKRYLLETLADAPRFREAHRLLLKMRDEAKEAPPPVQPEEIPISPTNQEDSL